MSTYLLIWSSDTWEWTKEQTQETLKRVRAGERIEDRWSTGNTKKIEPGDRVLLIKLGSQPRGLFASGHAITEVYQADHFLQERAEEGDKANYIDFVFDEFIDPNEGPLLDQALLVEKFSDHRWSPQGSGTLIPEEIEVSLEELWQKHLHEAGAGILKVVTSLAELRENIRSFDQALQAKDENVRFASINPTYFVYDPITRMFAPAKWAAFRGTTTVVYRALQNLQREQGSFRGFDGARAHPALSKLWGEFTSNPELGDELKKRFEGAFAQDVGTDPSSWRFLVLPVTRERFWWVNQGQSYREEIDNGLVWAPQERKDGGTPFYYWTNVSAIEPGDIIFSYTNGHIRNVGRARSAGYEAPRPAEFKSDYWEGSGWRADVEYFERASPIPLNAINTQIVKLGLERGPMNAAGSVTQGYLFELNEGASRIILDQISEEIPFLQRGGTAAETGDKQMPQSEPVNLILYGPPGTGKTYHTMDEAARLCDGELPDTREETMRRFHKLRDEKRVKFVTFHQSFGYEEFVEGIRPVLDEGGAESEHPDESSGDVHYECRDGVFKKLCKLAGASITKGPSVDPKGRRIWKLALGNIRKPAGQERFERCIENSVVALGYGRGLDYSSDDSAKSVLENLRSVKPDADTHDFEAAAVHRFKNRMEIGDLVVVPDGNQKFRAIGRSKRAIRASDDFQRRANKKGELASSL